MRTTLITLALVTLVGCEGFDEAMKTERKGGPIAPGGIATATDIEDVGRAADGQSVAPVTEQKAKSNDSSKTPAKQKKPKPKPNKSILGKTTAEVVDAKTAMKNKKIVPASTKISGSDPLTVAGSAYNTISARAGTLGMQQAIKQHKALNGKNPNFQEFQRIMKENRVEFPVLPPYQLYGYDEDTGGIIVLEDKAKKIQLFEKNGIPLEPGDEKFK